MAENKRLKALLARARVKPWAMFLVGFVFAWMTACMTATMTLIPANQALSARVAAFETERTRSESLFAPMYAPGHFDELRLVTFFDALQGSEKRSRPVLKLSTDELCHCCARRPHTYTVFER